VRLAARLWPLLVLAVAAALLMAPIIRHGLPIGHDSYYHLIWAGQFARALALGEPYPRWLSATNEGLGSPTFVFYPPFLYYLVAVLWWVAGSVWRALDLANGLALLGSGVGLYAYLRAWLPRGPALVGGIAAMALPYRLINLYPRTAVAESAAFLWPPLALIALDRVARAPSWRQAGPAALVVAAATAGLALTHLPSLVVWGPLLALAATWAPDTGWSLRGAARGWTALALGLGMAAIYLLPAYAERDLVQIGLLDAVGPAHTHVLYGPELTGGVQTFNETVSRVALATTWVVLAAGAAALWPGPGSASRSPAAAWAVVASALFLLMTRAASWLWEVVPVFPAIQFPWRLLVVTTPAAAVLLAAAIARATAPDARPPVRALTAAALVATGGALAAGYYEAIRPVSHNIEAVATTTRRAGPDAGEYRPRTAPYGELPASARLAVTPSGRARVLEWRGTRRRISVEAPQPARLRVRTFAYPGWQAWVDGAPAEVGAGPDGLIEVAVPEGTHEVALRFGSTPVRTAGGTISLASLLAAVAWAALGWHRP
jgi:hypothetical protein